MLDKVKGPAKKVGFIFNHDAGHQAGHIAPVLAALASNRPDFEVRAYISAPAMKDHVRAALPAEYADRVRFVDLGLPPGISTLARLLDLLMPASRVARLWWNAKEFRDLDAIVAPERTSLFLKNIFAVRAPKYIHVRHGAGDRAVGFHQSFRHFDLLLLQGNKYVRRLQKSGGLNGNDYALIGYPKFDFVDLEKPRRKFFDNDNPTVFYNPHFAPGLSSWNRMGNDVLEYFVRNPDLNLIFSPHVMLFKKYVHIAPDRSQFYIRRKLAKDYGQYKNIHVDLDSPMQFDMTYTLNSDLYLGDVSSQVMEFLVRPRPCVFLNPHHLDWRHKDEFAAWALGDVVEDISGLGPAIRSALDDPDHYEVAQKEHFSDTIDLNQQPSSSRAARVIGEFLERGKARPIEAMGRELSPSF